LIVDDVVVLNNVQVLSTCSYSTTQRDRVQPRRFTLDRYHIVFLSVQAVLVQPHWLRVLMGRTRGWWKGGRDKV